MSNSNTEQNSSASFKHQFDEDIIPDSQRRNPYCKPRDSDIKDGEEEVNEKYQLRPIVSPTADITHAHVTIRDTNQANKKSSEENDIHPRPPPPPRTAFVIFSEATCKQKNVPQDGTKKVSLIFSAVVKGLLWNSCF